ncbi:nitroreductase family protein [hydrocarbon metagenome]|uniref:Nitroreductase family protein n=1 Tax=hydrocarbon metagenome TaxID=938273 RepID=A0A0W8G9X4_9ZZZZ
MDALDAIHTRRSIRKYDGRPVSPAQAETLLRAAMAAPSAGNAQPWRFVVVTDRLILDRIPDIHPYAAMVRTAPLGILVLGDTSLDKYPGYWVLDCAAAIQNMLLAARAIGLGTVWTGVYPTPERVTAFSAMFALPGHVIPHSFVVVGHPAQEPGPVDRFNPSRIDENVFVGHSPAPHITGGSA